MMKEFMARTDTTIQGLTSTVRNLKNEMWQLAIELKNRHQGTLPSDTENPRREGKEHCKAVTLRSGKVLDESKIKKHSVEKANESTVASEELLEPKLEQQDVNVGASEAMLQQCKIPEKNLVQQRVPFPQRLVKKNQNEQFMKFLDILKQFHSNIPLVEAIENFPNYAKFMKDFLTKKRRLGEFEIASLTKECSYFIQDKLPPKMRDPRSFNTLCPIGNTYCGMPLCDLGASINLLPLSIFKQSGIGEVRPTIVTWQLADRSI